MLKKGTYVVCMYVFERHCNRKRERKRDGEENLPTGFTLQTATVVRTGPDQSQELGTLSESATRLSGTKFYSLLPSPSQAI